MTKEELAYAHVMQRTPYIRRDGDFELCVQAFLAGYRAAESHIKELEAVLNHIVGLSSKDGIQKRDKDAFYKEWEEWQNKAKELLKSE